MDIFSFIVSNETVGLILLWSSAATLAVLLLDLAGFVLAEILTHNFLGRPIEVGLKLFLICTLEMVVGSL